MYGFWRIGIYWPGVPPPDHGFFRLKQVCMARLRAAACSHTPPMIQQQPGHHNDSS
jgi:hypothetical protein